VHGVTIVSAGNMFPCVWVSMLRSEVGKSLLFDLAVDVQPVTVLEQEATRFIMSLR
jgi:hypothetical protein